MKKNRRKFKSAYKTQLALEALKERRRVYQIVPEFDIPPNHISAWKREFLDNASSSFGDHTSREQLKDLEQKKEELPLDLLSS
jgi:transposase